jgi:hypothetical protein
MSSEPASGSWWEPTWRRLAGGTVVLFVVILAFLVGRVRAGADPGLVREASPARQQQSAPPASGSGVDPQGADPSGPFAQPQSGQGVDPGVAGGSTDNFGNAIPDDQGSGSGASPGSGSGTQGGRGFDPPSTHVS